jgi:tryptophanyl-tRNA synthetase
MEQKKRVFSGIQPSGNLTIGNYIGALRQWVAEQNNYLCYFCVVDMHAITVQQDPVDLRTKSREVAAIYLASGIDPDAAIIFIQSHVAAHAELSWILTCLTPIGWLNRMTQFKDKSAKQQQDSISTGLLNYPVLMAADILLYQAHAVPVGDDQRQHLEITRDIAQRFNHIYGDTFILPEVMIPKAGARIMGLDNPLAKMSKSEASEYHAVYITDTAERSQKKIMRAVTDSGSNICFNSDPECAGVNNLLTIYQALTKDVAEAVNETMRPIREKYQQLIGETDYLDSILARGAATAREVSGPTLRQVQERVGFLPSH